MVTSEIEPRGPFSLDTAPDFIDTFVAAAYGESRHERHVHRAFQEAGEALSWICFLPRTDTQPVLLHAGEGR